MAEVAASAVDAQRSITKLDYQLDDYPGVVKTTLFGIQHVLVMFTGMIGAPLLLARLISLPPDQTKILVAASMIGCGVGTLISSLGIGFIGPRLPIVMGIFYVFIGPLVAITKEAGLATAMSALIIGGAVQLAISPFMGKLHRFFPPVVTGTVLIVIGACLMKIAINTAVGFNTPQFGKPTTLMLATGMIVLVTLISRFSAGMLRALSIFIAIACGYVASILFGLVDLKTVSEAYWFALPTLMPYGGFAWPGISGLFAVIVCFLAAGVETTGHTLAVCRMCGVPVTEARIRGAVANDGVSSAISALVGGMGLTSYSQNIGAITITGVGSRFVVAAGGAVLIAMALIPKIGAIIALLPGPVLGGAMIFIFGMIAAVGIDIIGSNMKSKRDALLFAASIGIALGITFAPPGAFDAVPAALRIIVTDGIVMGILSAVILNLLLPADGR